MGNILHSLHQCFYETLQWLTNDNLRKTESEASSIFFFFQHYQVLFLLAFIGGFTDAAGYMKFAKIFTASITGNLIQACAAIYQNNGVVARILVTVAFVLGGILGFSLSAKLKLHNACNLSSIGMLLYALEIVGFLITTAIGLIFQFAIEGSQDDLSDWRLVLAACFMGGTMGIQNAAARITIPNVLPTTAMTVTLVVQSKYLSDFLIDHFPRLFQGDNTDDDRQRLKDFLSEWLIVARPLIAFLIGAVVGVVLITVISYYALLLPVLILTIITVDIYINWLVTAKFNGSSDNVEIETNNEIEE